jgi:hypothetical protein
MRGQFALSFVGGSFKVLYVSNPALDLTDPMLDLGEVGLCRDAPLIRNLSAGFETPDAPFECGTIDHPPNENDQWRNKAEKRKPRISGTAKNPIAQCDERQRYSNGRRTYSPFFHTVASV